MVVGKYDHLHPSAVECIEHDAETRIQWMKKTRWIGYPRAQEVMGKLEDLLRHPREARMPSMLLIGGTNNGKTRLVRNFAQRHPVQENPDGEHVIAPVLYVHPRVRQGSMRRFSIRYSKGFPLRPRMQSERKW
jgi:hypothetical protein